MEFKAYGFLRVVKNSKTLNKRNKLEPTRCYWSKECQRKYNDHLQNRSAQLYCAHADKCYSISSLFMYLIIYFLQFYVSSILSFVIGTGTRDFVVIQKILIDSARLRFQVIFIQMKVKNSGQKFRSCLLKFHLQVRKCQGTCLCAEDSPNLILSRSIFGLSSFFGLIKMDYI